MEAYLQFDDYHIKITGTQDYIESIKFVDKSYTDNYVAGSMVMKALYQLQEYFAGQRKSFDLRLKIKGTTFENKVYQALLKIEYNHLLSYKELAQLIDNDKAARAVGRANNKNQLMIIVPCHRIIGSDGRLVGYAGGLDLKKKLIELEQNNGGYYG